MVGRFGTLAVAQSREVPSQRRDKEAVAEAVVPVVLVVPWRCDVSVLASTLAQCESVRGARRQTEGGLGEVGLVCKAGAGACAWVSREARKGRGSMGRRGRRVGFGSGRKGLARSAWMIREGGAGSPASD